MIIGISSVCKVFDFNTVGTRAQRLILDCIVEDLKEYDTSKDRVPGQHEVHLSNRALDYVSPGVARRTTNPQDYVVRMWRGRAEMFLKRKFSERATGVTAIVYTREAYGKDPDVSEEEMTKLGDATHVLVAVLAFAGPPTTPPAPWTFVRNLAGANNEELSLTADEIRAKAKAVVDYNEEWCVVAD